VYYCRCASVRERGVCISVGVLVGERGGVCISVGVLLCERG